MTTPPQATGLGTADVAPMLPVPPRAEVMPVEDLVRNVLSGQVRIPEFQRGWQWKGEAVRDLLDSLYRGYPIGSLLMWRRPRGPEELEIGSVKIAAPARPDAWAVVDGQQRLTAIVGTLAHTDARPDPEDMFAVWFDPDDDTFQPSPERGPVPPSWVPVSRLLDSSALQEFVFQHPIFAERKSLRQKVFEAGKRLREYRIPIYVVETDEQKIPREIFRRTNRRGTALAEADLFNALVGRSPSHPHRLEDLQREARDLGMGDIQRHKLLQCVMAVHGLDVTRRFDEQRGKLSVADALAATSTPLRSALVFLRNDARVPHLRLLPYPVPLIVLTRFFALHPEPNARCRDLLVRWTWRGMLTRAHEHGERTRFRDAVRAVTPGEAEDSALTLLRSVPSEPPSSDWWLDTSFDGRSAASRIAEIWIASRSPRDLISGNEVDVPALVDSRGSTAFQPVSSTLPGELVSSAANRVLHATPVRSQTLVTLAMRADHDTAALLTSHGFDARSVEALSRGTSEGVAEAIRARKEALRAGVRALGDRLARWGATDRKSIATLLRAAGDEE